MTTLRCIFSQLPSHCRPKIIQKKKTKPKAVRVRNRHAGKQNEATPKRPSGNKRKKHASQENIHPRHKSMSHRFNLETTKTRVKHWEGGRQEDLFIYLFKNGFRISTKDVLVVFRLVFILLFSTPRQFPLIRGAHLSSLHTRALSFPMSRRRGSCVIINNRDRRGSFN